MWNTLKTNWRDLLAFLGIGIAFSVLADLVINLTVRFGGTLPGLAHFTNLLQGFATFVGANLCAWLIGVGVAWPTINRWSHDQASFNDAWEKMIPPERLWVFVVIAIGELVAAALCFK